FRFSGSPLVLWDCRIPHAMVPCWALAAASASKPSAARAAGAFPSAIIHWPRARYAPVLVHSIISFASLSKFFTFHTRPRPLAARRPLIFIVYHGLGARESPHFIYASASSNSPR